MTAIAAAAVLGSAGLAACGGGDDDGSTTTSGSSGGGPSGTVALLLPENKTTRYEAQDRPLFEKNLKELCPNCKLIYSNAEQDAAKQQTQAEAAITNGADVLVLDSVDSKAAASIVARAKQSGIGVVAYDRPVLNADVDYFISFDNRRVGELQAQAPVDKLTADGAKGSIVMINGSPTDPNAAEFKAGAHSVLDDSVVTLAGLIGWQGALLWVLGDTGTVNITSQAIVDLAGPVIAGTSLFGGRGTVWSALLGSLVIDAAARQRRQQAGRV